MNEQGYVIFTDILSKSEINYYLKSIKNEITNENAYHRAAILNGIIKNKGHTSHMIQLRNNINVLNAFC
jgi:hypothetical protein